MPVFAPAAGEVNFARNMGSAPRTRKFTRELRPVPARRGPRRAWGCQGLHRGGSLAAGGGITQSCSLRSAPSVRRVKDTANTIDSLRSRLRKLIKPRAALPQRRRGHPVGLPGLAQLHGRLGRAAQEWRQAMDEYSIAYGDRFGRPAA